MVKNTDADIALFSERRHLPLHRYRLFRTQDLDLARSMVARQFCEHTLVGQAGVNRFDVIQHTADFGPASISYIEYGGAVSIGVERLGDFLLIVMPIAGGASFKCREGETACDRDHFLVMPSNDRFALNWSNDCRAVVLKTDELALRNKLSSFTGVEVRPPIRLAPSLDATAGLGRYLRETVTSIIDFCDQDDLIPRCSIFRSSVRDNLLSLVVSRYLADRGEHTSEIVSPRTIDLVMNYIRAHPQEDLNLERLATISGVSGRTLQSSYRKHRGITPMEDVRIVRLLCAREDLLRSDFRGPKTVTDIAMKWGFYHCGRFSAYYKAQFGELPSETLLR